MLVPMTKPEDDMMQEILEGFKEKLNKLDIKHFGYCSLCGEWFHADDMDEEYPDRCKSCIEATSDGAEGETSQEVERTDDETE